MTPAIGSVAGEVDVENSVGGDSKGGEKIGA